MRLEPEALVDEVSAKLSSALGERLLSLSAHGSWVAGDFVPDRSDVDLLALLSADPSGDTLERLARVHAGLVQEQPESFDRLEVDYVTPEAVQDVLRDTGRVHQMARISPGEPLHLTEASRHYVLNWSSALEHDRVLSGVSPRELLPPIGMELVQSAVIRHLEQWPGWVLDMRSPGAQAYAVLTVCRAAATLESGHQVSKRVGAVQALAAMPDSAALIDWARQWWFDGGSDHDPDRYVEVVEFVQRVGPRLVASYRRR